MLYTVQLIIIIFGINHKHISEYSAYIWNFRRSKVFFFILKVWLKFSVLLKLISFQYRISSVLYYCLVFWRGPISFSKLLKKRLSIQFNNAHGWSYRQSLFQLSFQIIYMKGIHIPLLEKNYTLKTQQSNYVCRIRAMLFFDIAIRNKERNNHSFYLACVTYCTLYTHSIKTLQ